MLQEVIIINCCTGEVKQDSSPQKLNNCAENMFPSTPSITFVTDLLNSPQHIL